MTEGRSDSQSASLVVIGNFDGLHRGHLAVLGSAVEEADRSGLSPVVLTFDPHPAVVLRGAEPQVLTSPERRTELIQREFPRVRVVVEPFTRELAQLSPRQFVETLLVERLGVKKVVVGDNFRFGKGRQGDVPLLRELGAELGFSARSHELEEDAGGTYSSSRVRQALGEGDLAEVFQVLGRPHALSGRVVRGDGRGRSIGVPTANLDEIPEMLPKRGVYACVVDRISAGGNAAALARGVANLGVRPTVGAGPSVEVHLLDFDEDLYGARLRVHFVQHLRDERRFPGLDELVKQIQKDIAVGREALAAIEPDPRAGGAWY